MISPHFTILAAALASTGYLLYLKDMHERPAWIKHARRARVKPDRVSWAAWAAAPGVALAAGRGAAIETLLVTAVITVGPAMVFVASLRIPGAYWKLTRLSVASGVLSGAALAGLVVTGDKDVAVILAMAAELFAALPTIRKSWKWPDTESWGTYAAVAVAAAITLLTVRPEFAYSAFPAWVLIECAGITVLVAWPRRSKSRPT